MRFRHIAGGLAAIMAAALGVPAAASAATAPSPDRVTVRAVQGARQHDCRAP